MNYPNIKKISSVHKYIFKIFPKKEVQLSFAMSK